MCTWAAVWKPGRANWAQPDSSWRDIQKAGWKWGWQTEVRVSACCPSGLYNLQIMKGKTYDLGCWDGFKIAHPWVCVVLGSSFIHVTNSPGLRSSNLEAVLFLPYHAASC